MLLYLATESLPISPLFTDLSQQLFFSLFFLSYSKLLSIYSSLSPISISGKHEKKAKRTVKQITCCVIGAFFLPRSPSLSLFQCAVLPFRYFISPNFRSAMSLLQFCYYSCLM